MRRVMNKTDAVLKHLQKNGSITSWEAITEFSATRLSSIIYSLRKKGYIIKNTPQLAMDRFGNEIQFVRYVYKGERTSENN